MDFTKVKGRLSENDWHDVADLCEQAADACELGCEEHTLLARKKAMKWMHGLAQKATGNAMRISEKGNKL